ncbi:MAG TPA: hypothetical protein VFB59_00970 [Candidatus Saccharimonadales bacterium]|nr:hypothetical protein [Candidatus Saccharimonadales bacterium]
MYEQVKQPLGINEQAVQVDIKKGHPLVRMFDHMGLAELTGTPEANRQFWQEMPFEQAERFFLWANGVIRGLPTTKRGYMPNEHAYIVVCSEGGEASPLENLQYVGPNRLNAREMLERVWGASRGIESDERAATLQALGIVLGHNLMYGNGRMARLAYLLRSEGYDGSEDAKAKLHES